MLRVLGAVGIALLLSAGACGGDETDSSSDDRTDNGGPATQPAASGSSRGSADSGFHACDLFTAEEISEIVGDEAGDGEDYLAVAPGATNWSWNFVFVEVLLDGGEDWYDAIHFADDEADVEEVEGLGEIATWNDFLGTLDVVDDDRFISIQPIVGFLDLDAREIAVEMAETALELP